MTPGQLGDAGGLSNRPFSSNCPPNPLASALENSVSSQAWRGLGLLEAGQPGAALCVPRAEYLIQAVRPESPRGRPLMWAFPVSANPSLGTALGGEHRCGRSGGVQDLGTLGGPGEGGSEHTGCLSPSAAQRLTPPTCSPRAPRTVIPAGGGHTQPSREQQGGVIQVDTKTLDLVPTGSSDLQPVPEARSV